MPHGDAKRPRTEPESDSDQVGPDDLDSETPMTKPTRADREPGRHATEASTAAGRRDRTDAPRSPRPAARRAGAVSSGDILGMLRRRILTLLVCLVIGVAAAFGAFSVAAKEYDAVSAVKVAPVTASGDTGATKDISTITESRIVTSTAVAARAAVPL